MKVTRGTQGQQWEYVRIREKQREMENTRKTRGKQWEEGERGKHKKNKENTKKIWKTLRGQGEYKENKKNQGKREELEKSLIAEESSARLGSARLGSARLELLLRLEGELRAEPRACFFMSRAGLGTSAVACLKPGYTANLSVVSRKIFGAKRDEVTEEWRKLQNAELHALYSSPDIIRNIKSRRLRWAGHVARMGESRNAYRLLVGRPEGKRPLVRPRRRWEDNIKMDLREVGYDRDWINLA
ncbi:hypothetical protein ANN_11553 [Periplaneta americana]|uniref:Uncharacterized protein n=1 Tax=Periplaneta americana TaxID=6978 RepID=A0ABQ8T729_PERAM|nr:hypothetical protein ANN_11553 [Periplaneta americana]